MQPVRNGNTPVSNFLTRLVHQHSKEINALIAQYNYKLSAPLDATKLILAYSALGQQFADQLYNIYGNPQRQVNADLNQFIQGNEFLPHYGGTDYYGEGMMGPMPEEPVKDKKSFMEYLNTGVGLLSSVMGLFGKQNATATPPATAPTAPPVKDDKIMGMNPGIFYGVLILFFVIIFFVLVKVMGKK